MKLSDLKKLMGIAESDTSQDAILSLYLEAALTTAKSYADKIDWNSSTMDLPGPIKLGIVRYVELSQLRKATAGVQSESMAGMTQTFRDSNETDNYYAEAYDYWKPFHTSKRGLAYRTSRRKDSKGMRMP